MSPREIVGMRLYRAVRDRLPDPLSRAPAGLVLDVEELPDGLRDDYVRLFPGGVERACAAADQIMEGWVTLFGKRYPLPAGVEWNRAPDTGKLLSSGPVRNIDYRVLRGGDPKVVWELNRHTFLPILGRAYFLSRQERYADRAVSLIHSWIEQCPPGHTLNWSSGIEIAIRIISWTWTLRFILGSRELSDAARRTIAESLFHQARYIRRHLSLRSSGNNHLITELAGLAAAGDALNQPHWISLADRLLEQQSPLQIRDDGVGTEQSPGYQANTMESYLLAVHPLERRGCRASHETLYRLSRGVDFLASSLDRDGSLYPLGDWDNTEILPLSGEFGYIRSLVNSLGWLAGRARLRRVGAGQDEKSFWLLGPRAFSHLCACPDARSEARRAFPSGGYYFLRSSVGNVNVRILFDCGPLGMPPLNGHGHSDALSFILYVNGRAVLIDPGTYTYYASSAWRDYFRSTAAHNTVRVDLADQARFSGPFCNTDRARATCLGFEDGVAVSGRQFAYSRGRSPVTHTRSLRLVHGPVQAARTRSPHLMHGPVPVARTRSPHLVSGPVIDRAEGVGMAPQAVLRISDRLAAVGPHTYELFFHVDGKWNVERIGETAFSIEIPEGRIVLRLDARLLCTCERGCDEKHVHRLCSPARQEPAWRGAGGTGVFAAAPPAAPEAKRLLPRCPERAPAPRTPGPGWMSRTFGCLEPATTIIGTVEAASGLELECEAELFLEEAQDVPEENGDG